jgi:HEPN domain-containing protein
MEEGNFSTAFHAEKKKPNSNKKLNFDTLKCGSCSSYVMVLWSAGEFAYGDRGLHDYVAVPWPKKLEKFPEHWPEPVGRFWLQAKRSLKEENWDAAAVMARSALQAALREQKATGHSLKQEIDNLSGKGLLPPIIKERSDNLRLLGNSSAHPEISEEAIDPKNVRDTVRFLDFLLEYLYDLPHQISEYRERNP